MLNFFKLLATLTISALIPILAFKGINFNGQTMVEFLAQAFMSFATGWMVGTTITKIFK